MNYPRRITRNHDPCQYVANSTALSVGNIDTDLTPEADEHRNEYNGVFDLTVDLEMVMRCKQEASDKADGHRYLRGTGYVNETYPLGADDEIEHDFKEVHTIEFRAPFI